MLKWSLLIWLLSPISLYSNWKAYVNFKLSNPAVYQPCLVIGKLLLDPGMKELYWDSKHGFKIDSKNPETVILYSDTITIAENLFYIPREVNELNIPELSYFLNSAIGQIDDHVYLAKAGLGSDQLEKFYDLSDSPPLSFIQKPEYYYYDNLTSWFSKGVRLFYWPFRKFLGPYLYAKVEIYDNFTLILTNKKYKTCRIFVYPNSFFIVSKNHGLVAFGHNTNEEANYYFYSGNITKQKKTNRRSNRYKRRKYRRRRRKR